MSDETKTAGTPEPEDADALEQPGTSGTPGTEDRDAESREGKPDFTALNLEWKAKAERVNELEQKIAALESRNQQTPAAAADESDELSPEEEAHLQANAAAGALWASALLKQNRATKQAKAERLQLQRDLVDLRILDKIPGESKQQKVLQHYERNRTRLGDIKAAQAEVDAEEYGAEVVRLRKQVADLTAKPDPDVVNAVTTHGRGGGERVTPKEMTEDQFDKESARIRAEKGELAEMKYQRENAARVR